MNDMPIVTLWNRLLHISHRRDVTVLFGDVAKRDWFVRDASGDVFVVQPSVDAILKDDQRGTEAEKPVVAEKEALANIKLGVGDAMEVEEERRLI